ncbi:MAG: aldehyde dehydrogenase family protein [Calditrichia bacterium]
MPLSEEQIKLIARRVAENLNVGEQRSHGEEQKALKQKLGIFASIGEAVNAAGSAFRAFNQLTLEQRGKIIANIRQHMLRENERLATEAHLETGLGRIEDKILKNKLVTEKTPGIEDLKSTAWSGDSGLTLVEQAPYGVIGAITPITNPTSTIICNTIGMVAAGNSVVFNVHPGARGVSILNIHLINQAIMEAGGPPNVVTAVENPTIDSAQELMHHPGVRLLVVTGGPGVVKAAMTSGKRAICAGPGNPPVVVDETADIDKAAKDIVFGASMDNNIICVDEKEVFVVDSVADQLLRAMAQNKAVQLNIGQLKQLERVIFGEMRGPRKPGVINKNFIGKKVSVILREIGVNVEDTIRLAYVEVDVNHPLIWTEQMLPVLPVCRVRNADEAIDLAIEAEHRFGHTASMHSKNIEKLSRMAREINCSIFVKNGPNVAGVGHGGEGYCSFSMASPTGEGLTAPHSFTRERRCTLVDYFRII